MITLTNILTGKSIYPFSKVQHRKKVKIRNFGDFCIYDYLTMIVCIMDMTSVRLIARVITYVI